MKSKFLIILIVFSTTFYAQAQNEEVKEKKTQAKILAFEAQNAMAKNEFEKAEAKYREAISKDPENAELKYNLGTVYHNKNKNTESVVRLNQSAKISESKSIKHKAFHNQGNVFMKEEKYGEAIEAYKNALRNDPTDEETRYNLALAKEKAKQQQQDQDQNKDKEEENKKNENEEGENKEDQEQNKDKKENQEGDQGKDQEENGEQNKQEKKEGEGDQEKPQPDKEQQGDKGEEGKEQSQQPVKGQMSPQQMKNLLEAMENQEKEIQDKINARRAKGQPKTTDKDW
ncbi:tetratricopeptide repeat protein [Mesonia aestuariivivens]|nr:tetratricopeptide repeat protein [Mesonia aestuariivivens]